MENILTSNLTPKIVDKVFVLLNKITDSQVKDDKMRQFLVTLYDNDERLSNSIKRMKGSLAINDSYFKLSLLQKKIVLKTFEIAFISSDTNRVMEKYLYEMKSLISKESKP